MSYDYFAKPQKYLDAQLGFPNEVAMLKKMCDVALFEFLNMKLSPAAADYIGSEGFDTVEWLDVCSGPGTISGFLHDLYQTVKDAGFCFRGVGIDISLPFVRFAKEKNPEWTFIQGDAVHPHFKMGSFDFISGSSAYHHIPDEYKGDFMNALAYQLAPEGRLILCDNFLPEGRREDAVDTYYGELRDYLVSQGIEGVLGDIETIKQDELEGTNEHKVPFSRLEEDVRNAGLQIVNDRVIWQPSQLETDNAGSHVLVLRKTF